MVSGDDDDHVKSLKIKSLIIYNHNLTFCLLILFFVTIWFNALTWNILGSQFKVSKLRCSQVFEDFYTLYLTYPDEMSHLSAFHLGLYYLPKYPLYKVLKCKLLRSIMLQ